MKHHIIAKFTESVTKEEKARLLPEIQELFNHCLSIDGITKVEVIPNVIDRPNRYDVIIAITMTEEALPVYDECEWHKIWKKEYGSLLSAKAIFDSAE